MRQNALYIAITYALMSGMPGCACTLEPSLAPACPQDLPCVETDTGAILTLECKNEVP